MIIVFLIGIFMCKRNDDGSANIPSETLAKYGLDDDNADLNFDNDDEKDDDINNN